MGNLLILIAADLLIKIGEWLKSLIKLTPPSPPAKDNFEYALAYVFPNEGGYSNRPIEEDHGGATNFGVTIATLRSWRNRAELKLDHVVTVTADDVKAMPISEAKEIYQAWYWTDVGFNLVKNRAIATCLFDQGILNGPKTAVMYAQLAANNCGAHLVVDGVVGEFTLAALAKVDVKKFLSSFRALLQSHFDAIVARDPVQRVNYAGWINRANRLLTLS